VWAVSRRQGGRPRVEGSPDGIAGVIQRLGTYPPRMKRDSRAERRVSASLALLAVDELRADLLPVPTHTTPDTFSHISRLFHAASHPHRRPLRAFGTRFRPAVVGAAAWDPGQCAVTNPSAAPARFTPSVVTCRVAHVVQQMMDTSMART